MADKGFLEDLGVGAQDERAVAAAIREQQDPFYALGKISRRALGGLAGGVQGLFTGETDGERSGRSFRGFLQNVGAGAQYITDEEAAQASGIDMNTLYARRRIRKELGKESFAPQPGEDISDVRERMARRAAEIAAASGAPTLQAHALTTLNQVRAERMEFDKLRVRQEQEEQELYQDSVVTAYRADGSPVSGQFSYRNDPETGKKIYGLEFSEGGELRFQPFGAELTLEDPNEGTDQETPDQRMRKAFGKKHVDETRSMVQANAQAMRKFTRVMANVRDYVDAGMDESVLSTSGRAVSWMDNAVRNIRGTITAFMPYDKAKGGAPIDKAPDPEGRRSNRNGGWSGWNAWINKAADPTDAIWGNFQLPQWAQGVSAEAQEHRAQILELAYMAARLAEPSNRGLSDKDIEAALAKISGDTSNPQQLLRRFMTLIADAAFDLEDRLDSYKSAIPGIGDDVVDSYFGGKLIDTYRQRRASLYADFGVSIDEYGRPIFEEVVDVQFDPQSGQVVDESGPDISELPLADQDALLNEMLGLNPDGTPKE